MYDLILLLVISLTDSNILRKKKTLHAYKHADYIYCYVILFPYDVVPEFVDIAKKKIDKVSTITAPVCVQYSIARTLALWEFES
jgi:hypothetical protein